MARETWSVGGSACNHWCITSVLGRLLLTLWGAVCPHACATVSSAPAGSITSGA